MIRVANILEEGKYGGPQSRVIDVAYFLRNEVKTEIIVSTFNSEIYVKKIQDKKNDYKIFQLRPLSKNKLNIIKYIFFFLPEVIALYRYFSKQQYDIVHVSGGAWQIKGVIAGWLSKSKVVWHLNDTSMPASVIAVFSFISVLPKAFIFSSESTRKYYLKKIKKRNYFFKVIHPPVDTTKYNDNNYVVESSIEKISENKKIIGTIANINPVKGIDVFIQMASELNKVRNDLVFLIVGRVYDNQLEYYNQCLELIREKKLENIHFISDTYEVGPYLKAFDIFVCTSFSESGPISLFEALSMSKPVVTTSVGDLTEFVKEDMNGSIVEIGNSIALAEKVKKILDEPSAISSLQDNSRKIAVNKLDIKHCANKHMQIYQKLMETGTV